MTTSEFKVTGGCLCGAIRYESTDAPTEGFYCHCRTCRKFFGSLFGAYVRIPRSTMRFTKGQPKYFRSSAVAQRGFCMECGSPMVFVYDGNGDFWISIGSLDHPEDWPLTKEAAWGPVMHGMVDRKVPWCEIDNDLPQRTSENALFRKQAEAALTRESEK